MCLVADGLNFLSDEYMTCNKYTSGSIMQQLMLKLIKQRMPMFEETSQGNYHTVHNETATFKLLLFEYKQRKDMDL